MYAPSKNTTTGNTTSYTGLGVNYAAGPLAVSAAMETVPTSVAGSLGAAAGDGNNTTSYVLTVGYKVGASTVYGAFENAKANGAAGASATDSGYGLGVKVPVGSAEVSVGLANEETTGSVTSKRSAYAAQVLYPLGKQAKAYFGIRSSKDNVSGADVTTDKYVGGLTMSF